MKRILLIFILSLFPLTMRAQYTSVMSQDILIEETGYTIVRNLSDTEVITYIHGLQSGQSVHRFTYENNSVLMYHYVDLPSLPFDSIIVIDFRIIDNILFFCGENTITKVGVIGTIDVSALTISGATIHIDYIDIHGTEVLNRLVAYWDLNTGNPRVAAVGYKNRICNVWRCGVLVDCANFLPGSLSANIAAYDLYSGGLSDIEQCFDVVETDDWVVTVGYGRLGGQDGLMLRRFKKNAPMDPAELDNLYFYKVTEKVVPNETRAVHIKENDIAVVYRGERIPNVTDFTGFRMFEIHSMNNINSQEYDVPYKSYIHEMAYMKQAELAVVLNDFPISATKSHFAYLIPYQSASYNSVFVHDDEWDFMSVTNLDGKFFVGSGPFHFLLRDAMTGYPAYNTYLPIPILCPEDMNLKISVNDNIRQNQVIEPLVRRITSEDYVTGNDTVNTLMLSIKCFSR